MNDSSEIEHGLDQFRRIGYDYFPESEVDCYLSRNRATNEFPAIDMFSQVFVACFCAAPDLLSQWRAYGKSGAGYCVGFDREELDRAGSLMGFELIPAIYDKSDQERIVASFMASAKAVKSIYEEVYEEGYDEGMFESEPIGTFWSVVLGTIIKLALCFKHPSFGEEQEWRLLSLSPIGPVQFRGGRWGVIPFVSIPFEKSCITEIRQGPTLDFRMTRRTLEMYLAAEYAGCPRIKSSKIPLRSL